jgi:tetratricopeptide (TPR) repeat protein
MQPDAADVVQNLGELYWKRGNLLEAERQYRKGYQLAKGYARAANRLAWFLSAGKAAHQYQQGKSLEAEETCEEAIRLNPNSAFVYYSMGCTLLADSNDWLKAEQLMKKSVDLASPRERPIYLCCLGELLSREPLRKAEAILVYREAIGTYLTDGRTDDADFVQARLRDLEAVHPDK